MWANAAVPSSLRRYLISSMFSQRVKQCHVWAHQYTYVFLHHQKVIFSPKDLNNQKVIAPEQVLDGQEESKRNTN